MKTPKATKDPLAATAPRAAGVTKKRSTPTKSQVAHSLSSAVVKSEDHVDESQVQGGFMSSFFDAEMDTGLVGEIGNENEAI